MSLHRKKRADAPARLVSLTASGSDVSISVDGIDPASWRTGQRSAECDVARFDATNHPTTLTAPLLPVH